MTHCEGQTAARLPRPPALAGFTLIELLVVIAIVAILAALLEAGGANLRKALKEIPRI